MRRPRRGRKRKGSKHLTISARNAEWEEVRAKADRRGLSIARYVKTLLDRDVPGGENTFTALAPEEQRELLDGVRELRALLTEEAAAPARDEETGREAPAPPAQDEEAVREPSAPRTREEAGQAESSDRAASSDPAEPDEPEPGQGRLPF